MRGEDQRRNCEMTPLMLVGLLVAILAGRGTVLAEITGGPALQKNPDVNAPTTEESTLGYKYTGNYDDTEADDSDSANNESSGNGEEGEITSLAGALLNSTCDTYPNCSDEVIKCYGGFGGLGIIIIVAVVLLIAAAVITAIFLCRRRKKTTIPPEIKEEEALAACDAETATIPKFDDDIPSVLELEMEDLQKWAVKTETGETVITSGNEGSEI